MLKMRVYGLVSIRDAARNWIEPGSGLVRSRGGQDYSLGTEILHQALAGHQRGIVWINEVDRPS